MITPSIPFAVRAGLVKRVVAGDEGLQAHHRIGAQAGHDLSEEQLLGLVQRRADDPLDPGPLRRLDLLSPAAGQQLFSYPVWAPLVAGNVNSQPVGQLLCLGNAALTEAKRPANLHAVALDLSPGPVIGPDVGRWDPDLACYVLDGVVGQFG